MTVTEYLTGLLFFVLTVGAAVMAGGIVVRRRLRDSSLAEQLLAAGVLASAVLIAAYVLPGLVGLLSRLSAAILSLLALAAATRAPRVGSGQRPARPAVPVRERSSWMVAALGGATVVVGVVAYLRTYLNVAVSQVDVVTFHLPVIARWLQTGSVWHVYEYVPLLGQGNYPQNGDVLTLATIAPWRNDVFEKLVTLPFYGMIAIAVYALARILSAPRAAAVTFGLVALAIPDVVLTGVLFALPDAVMFAMFGAGLVFLARSFRSGRRLDLLLAGIALGIAFGSKWYGVSCVVAVVALWLVASVATRRPSALVARQTATLIALVAVAGGFWLLRNIAGSGTPFFPAGWLPIGAKPTETLGGAGHGQMDFTIADYLTDGHVLSRYVLPGWFEAFRLPGVALLAAGSVGLVALVRERAARLTGSLRPHMVALATSTLLAAVYLVTPDTAQGPPGHPFLIPGNARYLVPAALPLAAVAAWAVGRLGRWGIVLELVALAAIFDGVSHTMPVISTATLVAATALVVVAAGLVVLGASWWGRSGRTRLALATALTVFVLGGGVGGQLLQSHFNAHRYAHVDPTIDWVTRHAAAGNRIGLAGTWSVGGPTPVYPAFGPRLRNYVAYVGPFLRGGLHQYTTAAAFAAALHRGRFGLLLIGLGDPPRGHVVELSWARAAGYREMMRSHWLALYAAPPTLLGGRGR